MDWNELRKTMVFPSCLPQRTCRLLALERVLDGSLYDHITNPFFRSSDTDGSYIPINRRRPSVRTNLCSIVVEDSVSLLFSSSHWPLVVVRKPNGITDVEREASFHHLIMDSGLPSIMEQAAVLGSVGSVALLVQAIDKELVIEIKRTCFLNPVFSLSDPRRLVYVREQYLVNADDLEKSHLGSFEPGQYWFTRDFTETETIWYRPVLATSAKLTENELERDEERSIQHHLGMVPVVWIRNLPGTDPYAPDGKSTFSVGIDAMIDADYLLSQTVRGLRYSADPTMVLSGDEYQIPGASASVIMKDAAQAISIPQGSDAKLLEINGTGASASLAMWEALRSLALESMHGNRAHGDRVSAAQSGRAMELMCLGLTWLTDRLRRSYGDHGLLNVLRLVGRISEVVPDLQVAGKSVGVLDASGLSLVWPPWFEPTFADMQTMANAVKAAQESHSVSMETAISMMRPATRVPDVRLEMEKILSGLRCGNLDKKL